VSKCPVVHSCGHEEERELSGNPGSQRWQADKWKEKVCSVCWRADVDSASAEAAMFAEQGNWPTLEGSAAQIGWARTIQAELVDSLPSRMAELTGMGADRGQTFVDPAGAIVLARTIVLEQTSAGWWINSRKQLAQALPELPGVRRRLKDAGDTGRTATALLLWPGAAMAS
jgi:hypothetical protein